MSRRTLVFGPAYLDRKLQVDRPLTDRALTPALDQSVNGVGKFVAGDTLTLIPPEGSPLVIACPPGWPGPTGAIHLSDSIGATTSPVHGIAWNDDLGGMGAGFASALRGTLVSALGPEDDPVALTVDRFLRDQRIDHQPLRVSVATDWTLLITSGPHGDKLPIGFRGAHEAIDSLDPIADSPCDLRVVAGLPNRLAGQALGASGARVRVFAPSIRNMRDREIPVSKLAGRIDALFCNRREWEALEDREQVAWQVALLVVTDGPNGVVLRFTRPDGDSGRLTIPAFPRARPPIDTNRAGETFASSLLTVLMDEGWNGSEVAPDLARWGALRASAASALVLDRADFGYPTSQEIDAALAAGVVA